MATKIGGMVTAAPASLLRTAAAAAGDATAVVVSSKEVGVGVGATAYAV